jgi:hypothetical protein
MTARWRLASRSRIRPLNQFETYLVTNVGYILVVKVVKPLDKVGRTPVKGDEPGLIPWDIAATGQRLHFL